LKIVKASFISVLLSLISTGLFSANALADTITTLTVGPLPTSLNYGDSFTSAATGTTFFDAYYFTIPAGSANSVTSSINLDSILGLTNLKARLYAGNGNDTTNSVASLIENWGTTVNFSPSVGVTTVVLNPITLAAGSYTLQIKGTVSGAGGGSYAGVLNITNPVPEPESYAMLLVGLGFMGFTARRRKFD
jgi:PEP-CTERM motif